MYSTQLNIYFSFINTYFKCFYSFNYLLISSAGPTWALSYTIFNFLSPVYQHSNVDPPTPQPSPHGPMREHGGRCSPMMGPFVSQVWPQWATYGPTRCVKWTFEWIIFCIFCFYKFVRLTVPDLCFFIF